jgi:hypothetical protein
MHWGVVAQAFIKDHRDRGVEIDDDAADGCRWRSYRSGYLHPNTRHHTITTTTTSTTTLSTPQTPPPPPPPSPPPPQQQQQ